MWDSVIVLFCCVLLCVHSSFAIISMGKRELIALFVFLVFRDCCVALPHDTTGLSAFVIVVFPDHTHFFVLLHEKSMHSCLKPLSKE